MTCRRFGDAIICDGRGKTERRSAKGCPWCWLPGDRGRMSLVTEIYDGYCAPDIICGRCGYFWTPGDDRPVRDQPHAKRETNVRLVRKAKERRKP